MAVAVRPSETKPKIEARFEALVLDFLAYLEFERGLARNTLDAYRTDLLQYGAFLAARGVGAIDAERADVADFLADLATGRPNGDGEKHPPCSPATINRKTAALRSFYRHLRREELIDDDPTASLSPPAKQPQASARPLLRRGQAPARERPGRRPDRRCATARCSS